jgi:hypothetical protein
MLVCSTVSPKPRMQMRGFFFLDDKKPTPHIHAELLEIACRLVNQ